LPSLIVFDLDGTLIDSRRDLADSANAMLASYGAPPLSEETVGKMVGAGAAQLVGRVLKRASVDASIEEALGRFLRIYDGRLTIHTRPYPGIPEVLDELYAAAPAMSLLTNKPLAQSLRILNEFGFAKYFRQCLGGDGPWPRKPAPDGLRFLMDQESVGPDATVLVGDSLIDLQTARNAAVHVCLAKYGFGSTEVSSDDLRGDELIAAHPQDIPRLLRGVAARATR